jgi:hypothetical protein
MKFLLPLLLFLFLFTPVNAQEQTVTMDLEDFYSVGNSDNIVVVFFDFDCTFCINYVNTNLANYSDFYIKNVLTGKAEVVPVAVTSRTSSYQKALAAQCILGIDGGYKYSQFIRFVANEPVAFWNDEENPYFKELLSKYYVQYGDYSAVAAEEKASQIVSCVKTGVEPKEAIERNNQLFTEQQLVYEELPSFFVGQRNIDNRHFVTVFRVAPDFTDVRSFLSKQIAFNSRLDLNKDGVVNIADVVDLIKSIFN